MDDFEGGGPARWRWPDDDDIDASSTGEPAMGEPAMGEPAMEDRTTDEPDGRPEPTGGSGARPVYRFPIPGYGEAAQEGYATGRPASLTAGRSAANPADPAGGAPAPMAMPHWSDPPTGEVPLIVPTRRSAPLGSRPAEQWDDPDSWEGFEQEGAEHPEPPDRWESPAGGGVNRVGWRDRESDWDDPGYEPARLGGDGSAIGALDETRGDPHDLYSFDDMVGAGSPAEVPASAQSLADAARQAPLTRPGFAGPGASRLGPPARRAPSGRAGRRGLGLAGLESASGPGDALGPAPGATPGAGGGDSGPMVRIATGVGVGALLLLALKLGPAAATAVATLLVVMAAAELYGVLRRAGYQPATLVGLVGTVCLMIADYLKGEAAIGVVVLLTMAVCLLWYLLGVERDRPTANLAATVLVFFWVGLLGSFAALLLSPRLFPDRHGEAFFLGAVIATVAYDVGALVVGSRAGRHRMAPSVSPNKTWEGMVGGIVFCLVISAVLVGRIHPWGTANAIALGVLVCVVAPLGDLCESVVKRDLGVKDMGTILPGHGGVLDRLDALLFVTPATYFLVGLLHIGAG